MARCTGTHFVLSSGTAGGGGSVAGPAASPGSCALSPAAAGSAASSSSTAAPRPSRPVTFRPAPNPAAGRPLAPSTEVSTALIVATSSAAMSPELATTRHPNDAPGSGKSRPIRGRSGFKSVRPVHVHRQEGRGVPVRLAPRQGDLGNVDVGTREAELPRREGGEVDAATRSIVVRSHDEGLLVPVADDHVQSDRISSTEREPTTEAHRVALRRLPDVDVEREARRLLAVLGRQGRGAEVEDQPPLAAGGQLHGVAGRAEPHVDLRDRRTVEERRRQRRLDPERIGQTVQEVVQTHHAVLARELAQVEPDLDLGQIGGGLVPELHPGLGKTTGIEPRHPQVRQERHDVARLGGEGPVATLEGSAHGNRHRILVNRPLELPAARQAHADVGGSVRSYQDADLDGHLLQGHRPDDPAVPARGELQHGVERAGGQRAPEDQVRDLQVAVVESVDS